MVNQKIIDHRGYYRPGFTGIRQLVFHLRKEPPECGPGPDHDRDGHQGLLPGNHSRERGRTADKQYLPGCN